MSRVQVGSKMDVGSLRQYWQDLSSSHLSAEDDGLAAICYAGMPEWFNRFFDVYQRKALARLLDGWDLRGLQVLDVGTGVGRWARWYADRGAAAVTGIDLEPARLATARDQGGPITYLEMPADALSFEASSFDLVNCITVLQHVPHDVKRRAIAEFGRVVRPGGHAVIFEVTHLGDDAPHVFPWSAADWTAEFERNGFRLRKTAGDQYTPLLRLLKTAHSFWRGADSRTEVDAMKRGDTEGTGKALLGPLHVAVTASYPLEEVLRFLPPAFAKITGFYFVKE